MFADRSNDWTEKFDTLEERSAFPSLQSHDATRPSTDELHMVELSGENFRRVMLSECALGILKETCELLVVHIIKLPSQSPDASSISEGLMAIAVTID